MNKMEAARRSLAKTGVVEVDESAAVLQYCLTRLEVHLDTKHVDRESQRKCKIVEGPCGQYTDISHREFMGAKPEVDMNGQTPVVNRSDVAVAMGSLGHLAQCAALAMKGLHKMEEENTHLRSVVQTQQRRILELEERQHLDDERKDSIESPQAAFEHYKKIWSAQHSQAQGRIEGEEQERRQVFNEFMKKAIPAASFERNASARRRLLDTTFEKLKMEFGSDEEAIQRVIRMFQPQPQLPSSVENETCSIPSSVASSPMSTLFVPQSHAESDVLEDRVGNFVERHIRNVSVEDVKGDVDTLLRKANAFTAFSSDVDEQVKPTLEAANINRNSLLWNISSVFQSSAVQKIQFVVCVLSTIGHKEALNNEARLLHLEGIWDTMSLYDNPTVTICTIDETPQITEVVNSTWDVRQRELRDGEAIPLGQKSSPARLLSLRRLPEQVKSPRKLSVSTESSVVQSRRPMGLLHLLGTDFGKQAIWKSPVGKRVRCYSSSKHTTCVVESIVDPFNFGNRTLFFFTNDEPGQFISISFDGVVVIPSAYSFASVHPISGGHYPRNWRLEASQDEVHWIILRRHVEDDTMNHRYQTPVWTLDVGNRHFQHFRVVNEGFNAQRNNILSVSSFEVYGRVLSVQSSREASLPSGQLPILIQRPRSVVAVLGALPSESELKGKGGKKR